MKGHDTSPFCKHAPAWEFSSQPCDKAHTRVPLADKLIAIVNVYLIICKAVVCLAVGVCSFSSKTSLGIKLHINPCPRVYSSVVVSSHTACPALIMRYASYPHHTECATLVSSRGALTHWIEPLIDNIQVIAFDICVRFLAETVPKLCLVKDCCLYVGRKPQLGARQWTASFGDKWWPGCELVLRLATSDSFHDHRDTEQASVRRPCPCQQFEQTLMLTGRHIIVLCGQVYAASDFR